MRLTENQLKFIIQACELKEVVYDFENNEGDEFVKCYGITAKKAEKVIDSLQDKVAAELKKLEKRKQ